jgi:acyl-CoA dehydrogenase
LPHRVEEMRAKARAAGVLTPHILPDGSHLTSARRRRCSSKVRPFAAGPACLQHDGARRGQYVPARQGRQPEQKTRFLEPLVRESARSAFFMTEPAPKAALAPIRR